jgi:polysaccharide deacetylase family protein (PEP-CTERM system associated)
MPVHAARLNALTIDVEDYFQVSGFENVVTREDWERYPSRVERNTHRLLELLARHGVRATCFVLGWVGRRFPGLVRALADAGHEIGCHSYWHRLIYQMTAEEFRRDLREGRDVLANATGRPVTAYRAPSFSITKQSLWALDILREEGIDTDASIFPIHHHRYGIPDADPFPHRIHLKGGEVWEFPSSVVRLGKVNMPVSGGGYFRLLPVEWTAACIQHVNERLGQAFIFYIHPWELDPYQPRLPAPWHSRWRHYCHLASTERKLASLLERFRFSTLSDVRHQYLSPGRDDMAPAAPRSSRQAGAFARQGA